MAQPSRTPPEATAIAAGLHPSLVLYFLVTDQFSMHLSGPILNLLSVAASTATGGSRLWEFPAHGVKKCFLLSALTQFAASFRRSPSF